MSSLRHPNVILYMGVCIDTNFKIIVMEYMEKGSLNDLLRKEPFTLGKMFKIAKEIALGMNYLHGEGILHRDLTSKNILLSSHMQAKVADFGLSKIKLAESQNVSFTMGSIAWMAPEVIENASNFTRASDVYSYGIILWEMCTGEDPCPRDIQPVHFAKLVLESGYRPEIPPTVSPKWKALIETCWDTLPKSRPSFEQILIRLEKMHTNFSPKQLSREIFLPAPVQRNNSPNTDQQINSEYGVMLGEDED
uniref:Protein kinase domain-containing protein n=1 Tax=Arcella intermedia TaxID=1963864 RepID=A0A6B2LF92_9EUKA